MMSKASASALVAAFCRPTCGVHRRSPRCCRFSICAGSRPGDLRPALEGLLGEDAAGLSPANSTRLTACWEKEYTAFRQRDLAGREYV